MGRRVWTRTATIGYISSTATIAGTLQRQGATSWSDKWGHIQRQLSTPLEGRQSLTSCSDKWRPLAATIGDNYEHLGATINLGPPTATIRDTLKRQLVGDTFSDQEEHLESTIRDNNNDNWGHEATTGDIYSDNWGHLQWKLGTHITTFGDVNSDN